MRTKRQPEIVSKVSNIPHDNTELRLWHEWQGIAASYPRWEYEHGESGRYGPSESLVWAWGSKRLRVLLGGNGLYTPVAELTRVPKGSRVVTCGVSPQTRNLGEAIEAAVEVGRELGKPLPPLQRGRTRKGGAAGERTGEE